MLFYRLYRLSLFIKKCFELFDKYKKIIKRRKNTFDSYKLLMAQNMFCRCQGNAQASPKVLSHFYLYTSRSQTKNLPCCAHR